MGIDSIAHRNGFNVSCHAIKYVNGIYYNKFRSTWKPNCVLWLGFDYNLKRYVSMEEFHIDPTTIENPNEPCIKYPPGA